MALALTGPATAFLALSDATLVYSVDPATIAAGSYAWTLTETQAGYDNSPHVTTGTIVVEAANVAPIARTVTPIADRTWVLQRVPANTNNTLPSYFATTVPQSFDPGDRNPWFIDVSKMLSTGEVLKGITALTPSTGAAALSISIDTDDRRPAFDITNGLIEFRLVCNASDTTAFRGLGTLVGIDFTFQFISDGIFTDTQHKTLGLLARIA